MQDIHHVVMPPDKGLKHSSRFRDVAFAGSDKVRPILPVGSRHQMVAREHHRYRAPREIVDRVLATDEKVADGGLDFAIAIASALATIVVTAIVVGKATDRVDLCRGIRTVIEVDSSQTKGGAIHYWLIGARQQDAEDRKSV